jgi:hypothetical protein
MCVHARRVYIKISEYSVFRERERGERDREIDRYLVGGK